MRLPLPRRALVTALVVAMTCALTGSALAAPAVRDRAAGTRPNPDVVMRGSGWGHGVGLSQFGAYAQSRAGWGYRQILNHYYSDIVIEQREAPPGIKVGLHQSLSFSNVDAVTGRVPWRAKVDGRLVTTWQPKGTTWQVGRTSTGAFKLTHNGNSVWRGQTDQLIAGFNTKADPTGTRIEAYNPNFGLRSGYKWGRLEYTPSTSVSGALNLVIQIPSVELYMRGLGEMPPGWGLYGGDAALKAQAILGRSYAMALRASYESSCRCQILATPRNQTYTGWDQEGGFAGAEWVSAVQDTARILATYQGSPVEAFYSSSHGGRSENIEDSWAYTAYRGYARSVDDHWSLEAPGNYYDAWEHEVTNSSFAGFAGSGLSRVRRVEIVSRTDGGSPRALRVRGRTSGDDPVTVARTGARGIAAIDLRWHYGLRSQQVKSIGFQPFVDDDGTPHEYNIVFATDAGIMSGRSAKRFVPSGIVKRADAALYLYRTLRLAAPTRDYYTDDNHRSRAVQEAINALAKAGISGGLRGGVFNPDENITRGQAATFFFRALDPAKASSDYYGDDDSSRHEVAINALTRKGLLDGCGRNSFCPGAAFTRGTMATLLYRTVKAYR